MTVARAVISIVPTIAGPMPPTFAGSTDGGIGLVRNCQLMTEAPLAITVNRTNPSGMITSTNASHIRTVAMRFLVRRQRRGSRRSAGWPALVDSHQAPRFRRAERSTTPRAMMLMMIVMTNSSTPSPISAARNTPVASPNSFAMTEGML